MTQSIVINGASWRTAIDAIDGLLFAFRPLCEHGSSIDAFIDSMIFGGMLEVEPPYEVVVENLEAPEAISFVDELSTALAEARAARRADLGDDIDVSVRRAP